MSVLILLIILPGLLLLIPTLILFIEVLAAWPANSADPEILAPRSAKVAIVVPAHDEEEGLLRTLRSLHDQMSASDRIVVVADNCSDDTASIGLKAGVEVIVRNDRVRIGKGYALGAGMTHLASDPPDVVLFCDADCLVQPGFIDRLVAECERTRRPVQACYLMQGAPHSPTDQTFAEFAWLMKNLVRPLGLRQLGGPCQLMGTGMMFSWDAIRKVPLASGNLVEDLQLGLDLAMDGSAPLFVPSAVTTSVFPVSQKGADTQRKRWVEGHLATIKGQFPRLLAGAIKRADRNLLWLALDVAVPPTVLLAGLIAGALCLAGVGVLAGLPVAIVLPATLDSLLFGAALALAWGRFGSALRRKPALSVLFGLWRATSRVHLDLVRGRKAAHWVRTERETERPLAEVATHAGANINMNMIEINRRRD